MKEGLEIIPVSVVSEVLDQALVSKPEPIDWDEKAYLASLKEKNLADNHGSVIKH